MTKKKNNAHLVVDAKQSVLRCQHCNETIPIPVGDIMWWDGVLRTFQKVHINCQPGTTRNEPLCRFQIRQAPTMPDLKWSEDDQPLPEDDQICAAHPLRTGNHERYVEAMRLVGAKRSKYALVDLVNWLLSRIPNERVKQ
jgi:hypothetical protein